MYYCIMSVVLLINLLIAVMARTFDKIFESAILHYQQQLAVVVLDANEEWPVPPPLTILSLPYLAFSLLVRSAQRAVHMVLVGGRSGRGAHRRGSALRREGLGKLMPSGESSLSPPPRPRFGAPQNAHADYTKRLVKMHKFGGLVTKVRSTRVPPPSAQQTQQTLATGDCTRPPSQRVG
jgi:hypothetical protein